MYLLYVTGYDKPGKTMVNKLQGERETCLLYTSDAADEKLAV